MACAVLLPHMAGEGARLPQTAGRSGRPKSRQRFMSSSCTQRTPAGLLMPLTTGMPGIGLEIEGAMQQAAQPGRQSMGLLLIL